MNTPSPSPPSSSFLAPDGVPGGLPGRERGGGGGGAGGGARVGVAAAGYRGGGVPPGLRERPAEGVQRRPAPPGLGGAAGGRAAEGVAEVEGEPAAGVAAGEGSAG